MQLKGKLHLFPSPISEDGIHDIPSHVVDQLLAMKFIITERVRTTRRFLKSAQPNINIDEITFIEMDKHDGELDTSFVQWCKNGHDVGLLSEAGTPCIADPGHRYVNIAHQNDIIVKPYVGPNSIVLALMASGFNGQHFEFLGYLPRNKEELKRKLLEIEKATIQSGKTHIFIETPYRNQSIMMALSNHLKPKSKICIAADLTGPEEIIIKCSADKIKSYLPQFEDKKPAIFIIGKG